MSLKKKNRRSPAVKLDPIYSRSLSAPIAAPNPLDVFPSKGDTLSKTFFFYDVKNDNRKKEETTKRWLDPERIDPQFGLKGNDGDRDIRRAYRRLESSALFNPDSPATASLTEISGAEPKNKNFVLVEESRLAELTKLEAKLQKEKQLLGEQCAWVLDDYQMHARIPIPATRLAMRNLCDRQMQIINKDIKRLNRNWAAFCKQNHYDRPHLYTTQSYVDSAPPGQRAMKLRLVKSAAETWRLRKDRDTMLFEDDHSYLTNKLVEAHVRLKDYERYYILAARYGPYSEETFNKDSRPGKRYFIAATTGALKFQMLWDRFWAMARLRRYRAARIIQKYVRRLITYKNINPIIKLRLKIGKKTYYFFCWNRWVEYNNICRKIKQAIEQREQFDTGRFFRAFRVHCLERKQFRQQQMILMIKRSGNANLFKKLVRWKEFTLQQRKLKIKLKRLFAFPHFDVWVQYTSWSKHVKKLNRSALRIQALCRMFLQRVLFLTKKQAQRKLRDFNIMIIAIRSVRARRQVSVLKEFKDWKPDELVRKALRANEFERKRIAKRQTLLQEKEKAALKNLRKHLKTSHGQLQISELLRNSTYLAQSYAESRKRTTAALDNGASRRADTMQDELHTGNDYTISNSSSKKHASREFSREFAGLNKSQRIDYAKQRLLTECASVARMLETHNFNTRQAPYLCCPDPACNGIFTTEDQYHGHMIEAPCHDGKPPQFSAFHMMLRHYAGQDLFRGYLIKKQGISGLVNCLDAWIAVQEWRKVPTNNEQYVTKAMNIYDLFIAEGAPRFVNMDFPGLELTRVKCEAFKHREHNGFYQLVKAHPSKIREIVGFQGQEYYQWNTSAILLPNVFNSLEWYSFLACFNATLPSIDPAFQSSDECSNYHKALERDAVIRESELLKDYERYRLSKIRLWTHSFKGHETAMSMKAAEATDLVLQQELNFMYRNIEKEEVQQRTIEKSMREQAIYEAQALASDDAVYWVGDETLDFIFDFYVTSLLNKMLLIPECRKGLLQYSGLMKASAAKRLAQMAGNSYGNKGIGAAAATGEEQQDDWFGDFFKDAQEQEGSGAPLRVDWDTSVVGLQARVRGMIARNRVRDGFFNTFRKYYDTQYHAYYYYNTETAETSWTPPAFMHHLFPGFEW